MQACISYVPCLSDLQARLNRNTVYDNSCWYVARVQSLSLLTTRRPVCRRSGVSCQPELGASFVRDYPDFVNDHIQTVPLLIFTSSVVAVLVQSFLVVRYWWLCVSPF